MALLSSCGQKPLYGMASQIRPQTIQKLSFYRISCVPFKLLEQWLFALAPELICRSPTTGPTSSFHCGENAVHIMVVNFTVKKAHKAAWGHPDPCYCTVATDTLWHQGLGLCIYKHLDDLVKFITNITGNSVTIASSWNKWWDCW